MDNEDLGKDTTARDMVSVHRQSYTEPPPVKLDNEQKKKVEWLRGHHFKFGSCAPTVESNMTATFRHPGKPGAEVTGEEDVRTAKLEELLQANFTLGSDKNP